ncbi:MAG: hypothetical protein NC517_08885 [Firmicutes bacterium]|nr:hypothetical protein [Bacillota bacterium]
MKDENIGNDLISRSALLNEIASAGLDNEDDVFAWIRAAPAVPGRAKSFVRCAECDDCHWSEDCGLYLCGSVMGMGGALDPKNDGCTHGRS